MLLPTIDWVTKRRTHCSFSLELVAFTVFPHYLMLVALTYPSAVPLRKENEFALECARLFGEFAQSFGVPRSTGQIYGLLFASPSPLCFSNIVEYLDISKGSASQGLQLLRSLGAINEAKGTDTRRVVYDPELSLRQLVTGVLRERVAPMASTGADRLKRLRELAEDAPENTKFYLGRAKQLETWRKRFTTVMPLFIVLLGPNKKSK